MPASMTLLGKSLKSLANPKQHKIVTAHVKCFLPGKLAGDSVPKGFIGAGPEGTLCLVCTNIPNPQKKSRWAA